MRNYVRCWSGQYKDKDGNLLGFGWFIDKETARQYCASLVPDGSGGSCTIWTAWVELNKAKVMTLLSPHNPLFESCAQFEASPRETWSSKGTPDGNWEPRSQHDDN